MLRPGLLELTSIYFVFEPVVFIGLILLIMRSFYLGWISHELIDQDRLLEGNLTANRGLYWAIGLGLLALNIWLLADHFVLFGAIKWIGLIGTFVCLWFIFRAHYKLDQIGFHRK